jgi:hypothetical protein
MLALPRTLPSASTATVVRASGDDDGVIQSASACSEVSAGS